MLSLMNKIILKTQQTMTVLLVLERKQQGGSKVSNRFPGGTLRQIVGGEAFIRRVFGPMDRQT